jgi:cell fate (sporulation/competence/biofilm development) regulator YlbF (YheA/YmcA/DUF963 family)
VNYSKTNFENSRQTPKTLKKQKEFGQWGYVRVNEIKKLKQEQYKNETVYLRIISNTPLDKILSKGCFFKPLTIL